MPTEKAIRDHWREWLAERADESLDSPDLDDICFACGFIPDYARCERAHITAKMNGGPNAVENLHMLCRVCHIVSEYREGDDYWFWLESWTLADRLLATAILGGFPVASLFVQRETTTDQAA